MNNGDVLEKIKIGDRVKLRYKSIHNQRQHIRRKGEVIHVRPGIHFTVEFDLWPYTETYLMADFLSRKTIVEYNSRLIK